jgi:hypothetical protein
VRAGRYGQIEWLLENGAQINEKNAKGLTPLQIAILHDRGTDMLRFLIDRGAQVYQTGYEKQIKKYLLQKGLSENNIFWFTYQKCPKLNALEVFQEGDFHPLSKVKGVAFTKPIALFNVAAYEAFGPYYGAIGLEFVSSAKFLSLYKKVAEKFTVVRVRVDDPKQFVPIMRKVREAFPELRLQHWSLHAHGNRAVMRLAEKVTLNWNHRSIMEGIGEEMDPSGSTIGLSGCLVAEGNEEDVNISRVFSVYAPKQIVCGAPHETIGVLPTGIEVPALNIYALLPVYRGEKKGNPALMKAYKSGVLIADGYLPRSRM